MVVAWTPEGPLEQFTRQKWRARGCVIGVDVIADGRESEVALVEQLTKGSGRGIVVRKAKVLLVVLLEEVHVIG